MKESGASLSQVKLGDTSREISPLAKWRGPLVSQVMPAVTQSAVSAWEGGGGRGKVEGGRVGTPKWTIKKGGAPSRTVSLEAFHRSGFFYRCCHISLGLAGYPGGVFTRFDIINMRLFFITCIDAALITSIKLSQPSVPNAELRSGKRRWNVAVLQSFEN